MFLLKKIKLHALWQTGNHSRVYPGFTQQLPGQSPATRDPEREIVG